MLRKLLYVSLQTKITGLVTGIMLSLIILLLGVFAYFDIQQVYTSRENLSLQTSKTLAFNPEVEEAIFQIDSKRLQLLVNQYSSKKNGMFAVIQNKEGRVVYHPNNEVIGKKFPFDDGYMAVVFGGYYTVESDEFIGPAMVGKSPVYSNEEQIIGVVSVGYLKEEINKEIVERLKSIFYFALFIFILGILLSFLLARHIRKETMGLEPREIATLYRSRSSILASISEGVIATDEKGRITLMNNSAKKLLDLSGEYKSQRIESILPQFDVEKIKKGRKTIINKEMNLNHRDIIMNLVPIIKEDTFVGIVATLRDKTQITEMLSTLSEVKEYSDNLRAQTHEFSNKMHVISGLIQLGRYDEVHELVKEELNTIERKNRLIFEQIQDPKVQAVLLGKISKASEKKVHFLVDSNSSLEELPQHIEVTHIITIIGNLIDNAFDAVMCRENRNVTFFALDYGNDIIFEITDNGKGLKGDIERLFERGFSTKGNVGEKRGFGLFNVKESINSLNGSIEIDTSEYGTTFSVIIPKTQGGMSND
ncbi:ATP-binding protein [Aquibacillus sediminis]|uniref:ATP-binding protein n=1 Tax=Aquibacillus sediminis TaxID=2574734 RepID=UPI001109C186|nr:sensor histidine kinase [Aquibacillus sediminis]